MADVKNFGLSGVGSTIQLGKAGPKLKNNSGAIEAKNAADNAFAVFRVGNPVGLDDAVNRRYIETRANVIVTGQINGSSPPAVVSGVTYLCTTTGGTYTAGRLYFGENAVWNEIIPQEGLTISVTDALTGGTLTFAADHRYLFDSDSGNWVDIGPAPAETKLIKAVRTTLAFNSAGTVNIGSALPTNATVSKILVNCTQAFNGVSPTVTFGVAGQVAELGAANESDLTTTGVYVIDCFKTYVSNEQLIATYVAGISSTGAASIEVHYSIV